MVPSWDGSGPFRNYRRRIDLFLSTTGIDPPYRAGRLIEQLTGEAWLATETLEMSNLRTDEGVTLLMEHLRSELEPLEQLTVCETLVAFYQRFRRAKGEQFTSYDTNYRIQFGKLEEVGAPLTGVAKAFWFLQCAGISEKLRKQTIAAAGGVYQYEKLRAALISMVPDVNREDKRHEGRPQSEDHQAAKGSFDPKKKFFAQKKTNRVNMVDEKEQGEGDAQHGDEAMSIQDEPTGSNSADEMNIKPTFSSPKLLARERKLRSREATKSLLLLNQKTNDKIASGR